MLAGWGQVNSNWGMPARFIWLASILAGWMDDDVAQAAWWRALASIASCPLPNRVIYDFKL